MVSKGKEVSNRINNMLGFMVVVVTDIDSVCRQSMIHIEKMDHLPGVFFEGIAPIVATGCDSITDRLPIDFALSGPSSSVFSSAL